MNLAGRGRLAAALVAVASMAACAPTPIRAPRTFDIVVDQMAFGAAPADIHVGDTVRWVNKDIFQHSATSQVGGFDVELPAGTTAGAVMTRAGTISYTCKYHPGMKSQLSVSS